LNYHCSFVKLKETKRDRSTKDLMFKDVIIRRKSKKKLKRQHVEKVSRSPRKGGESKGQKQDGLISQQRGSLIAPELREQGETAEIKTRRGVKGEGDTRGYCSLECHLLFRPALTALVSSRLPFRHGFIRTSPRRSLNSRRGEIYTKTWQCSRTRCRSGPAVFQVSFPRLLLPYTHKCRGMESVHPFSLVQRGIVFDARL